MHGKSQVKKGAREAGNYKKPAPHNNTDPVYRPVRKAGLTSPAARTNVGTFRCLINLLELDVDERRAGGEHEG